MTQEGSFLWMDCHGLSKGMVSDEVSVLGLASMEMCSLEYGALVATCFD